MHAPTERAARADRLPRWLDMVDVETPVLVGDDLGGGMAPFAAVRRPDRFSGIVLTPAVCYDSWPIPGSTPEDHPEIIAAAVDEVIAPQTSEEPR